MEPSELELYTTRELVDELMRRRTFYGCIVHSVDDHKGEAWTERTFSVRFNRNMERGEAGRLLETVANFLELNLS